MSKVEIKLNKNTCIEMNIDERIVVVDGDSGSGKTFIVNTLSDMAVSPNLYKAKNIDASKLRVYKNNTEASAITDCPNEFIVLDRYDTYSKETKQKIWDQMAKLRNTWLIMSRRPDIPYNWGYSLRSFKEVKTIEKGDNMKIYLETKS